MLSLLIYDKRNESETVGVGLWCLKFWRPNLKMKRQDFATVFIATGMFWDIIILTFLHRLGFDYGETEFGIPFGKRKNHYMFTSVALRNFKI